MRIAALCAALLAFGGCGPRVAHEVVRYPNGRIQSEVTRVDGKRHGPATSYYESGQVAWRGSFDRGFKHGFFEYFDQLGRLTAKKIYDRGVPVWESRYPDEEPPSHLLPISPVPIVEETDETEPTARQLAPSLADAGRRSYVGSELRLHRIATADTTVRGEELDVFGEYALGRWGFGGRLTGRSVADDDATGSQGGVDKAIVELGAAHELATPIGPMALRARVFAPLGSDSEERFARSSLLSYGRPRDAALAYPQAAGLRLDGVAASRRGRIFYRAGVGLDVAFDFSSAGAEIRMDDEVELLGRLTAAAGIIESRYFGGVELANVGVLTEDVDERYAHAVSGMFAVGFERVRPTLRITMPIDAAARGDSVSVTLGVVLGEGGWRQ